MSSLKNYEITVNIYLKHKVSPVVYKINNKGENAYADNGFFIVRLKDKDNSPKVYMYPSENIDKITMSSKIIDAMEEEPVVISPEEAEKFAYTE